MRGVQDWSKLSKATLAAAFCRCMLYVLNHVSGTFAGVAGVYNRFQYVDEMRMALDLWAKHVDKLLKSA